MNFPNFYLLFDETFQQFLDAEFQPVESNPKLYTSEQLDWLGDKVWELHGDGRCGVMVVPYTHLNPTMTLLYCVIDQREVYEKKARLYFSCNEALKNLRNGESILVFSVYDITDTIEEEIASIGQWENRPVDLISLLRQLHATPVLMARLPKYLKDMFDERQTQLLSSEEPDGPNSTEFSWGGLSDRSRQWLSRARIGSGLFKHTMGTRRLKDD